MIILDQLDESWLEEEIPEYSKILINLINVCKSINTDKKLYKNIKIICVMIVCALSSCF